MMRWYTHEPGQFNSLEDHDQGTITMKARASDHDIKHRWRRYTVKGQQSRLNAGFVVFGLCENILLIVLIWLQLMLDLILSW